MSWRLPLAVALVLAVSGCASGVHRAAAPHPLYGYADIDSLVRLHPGWHGVAQYDEALARLGEAAKRAPLTSPDAADLVALSPADEGAPAPPQLALQESRRRLESVERSQILHLRDRQARNRSRQIALKRLVWERDAAVEYARNVAAARSAYARQISLLDVDQEARRLNLTLQIRSLKTLISDWDASKPPTPELNQARADLPQKQQELAELIDSRRRSGSQAVSDREAAIRVAAQARDASVSTLVTQEEARLRIDDDRQASALQEQLDAQQETLLRQERSLASAAVPPVGGLGAQRLPNGPALATAAPGAGHSFRLAAKQLRDERARWVAYLYSDTKAAVQDAATQKHWVVTYGRPVSGERDLTAALAQALAADVWKT